MGFLVFLPTRPGPHIRTEAPRKLGDSCRRPHTVLVLPCDLQYVFPEDTGPYDTRDGVMMHLLTRSRPSPPEKLGGSSRSPPHRSSSALRPSAPAMACPGRHTLLHKNGPAAVRGIARLAIQYLPRLELNPFFRSILVKMRPDPVRTSGRRHREY